MLLDPGTTLGPYAVTAKIGEGGMGEVYRARDTKLDRDVALKVLPPAFTDDPDRLARFEREAKVLASLNHPNIGHIYGLEEAEGQKALVLELIEGPTLADRIKQGPIPVDEALPIAKQIAEALEAAHEQGVIHRDLKPANIKVREDGTVKVLDFGLAKALDTTPQGDPSQSPTLTAVATQMGVIMGTAAYMSPEQARGKAVDKRADIWAFGAVLYEMFTGVRPFTGGDVSETLARVIDQEPDWDVLPHAVPPVLGMFLSGCLEKNPRQRVGDIRDVRLAMEGAFETTAPAPITPGEVPRLRFWQRPAPATLAVLGLVGATAVAVWSGARPTVTQRATYLELALPAATSATGAFVNGIAISADGRRILVDTGTGPFTLYALDQPGGGVALAGTEGATHPMLSPDGASIAYVANNALVRQLVSGGTPERITTPDTVDLFGVSWTSDDRILFVPTWQRNILVVPAAPGSEPMSFLEIDASIGEVAQTEPQLLPDGRVLYGGWGDSWFVAIADPESGDRTVLFRNSYAGRYVLTGHVVYAQEHYLFARTLDLDTLEVGEPVQLLDDLNFDGNIGHANFAVSDSGVLAYLTGPEEVDRPMVKIWPDGRREPLAGTRRRYANTLRLSPDGRQIVTAIFSEVGGWEIWVYDLERDSFRAIAQDPGTSEHAIWLADGQSVVWTTETLGAGDLLIRPADASAPARPLFVDERFKIASSAHPSGKYVVSTPLDEQDLWVHAEDDPTQPEHFLPAPGMQWGGSFSPDGRHMVYDSEEFGASEIFVRPYPRREDGNDWFQQISRGGGERTPVWVADDRIVYRQGTRAMEVRVTDDGSELTFSDPVVLFDGLDTAWDIAPDGAFFVSLELVAPPRLMVVLDWFDELQRLVPTN